MPASSTHLATQTAITRSRLTRRPRATSIQMPGKHRPCITKGRGGRAGWIGSNACRARNRRRRLWEGLPRLMRLSATRRAPMSWNREGKNRPGGALSRIAGRWRAGITCPTCAGLGGDLILQLRARMLEEVAPTREREFLFDDEAAILELFVAKRIADQK